MKALLRLSITVVLVFAGYAAFAASTAQSAGVWGPAPTCNCNPPSVK